MAKLYCIVEGKGDKAALPVLLRRLMPGIVVGGSWPVNACKIFNGDCSEVKHALDAARVTSADAVLVLLDTDCERCPKEVASALLDNLRGLAMDLKIGLALAHCEIENWFLAAAESLRGYKDLPSNLQRPLQPEARRGAKEWLSKHMGRKYSPALHQAGFAARMDLHQCRQHSRSFRHLCTTLEALLE